MTEAEVVHAMHIPGLAPSPPKLRNRGTASRGSPKSDAVRTVLLAAHAAGGRAGGGWPPSALWWSGSSRCWEQWSPPHGLCWAGPSYSGHYIQPETQLYHLNQ